MLLKERKEVRINVVFMYRQDVYSVIVIQRVIFCAKIYRASAEEVYIKVKVLCRTYSVFRMCHLVSLRVIVHSLMKVFYYS